MVVFCLFFFLQRSNGLMAKAMTKNMISVVNLRPSPTSKRILSFYFDVGRC